MSPPKFNISEASSADLPKRNPHRQKYGEIYKALEANQGSEAWLQLSDLGNDLDKIRASMHAYYWRQKIKLQTRVAHDPNGRVLFCRLDRAKEENNDG